MADERLEHPVRESRLGVGLEHDGRDAKESGHEHDRPPRVSAHAQDGRRAQAADELDGLDHRPRKGAEALEHAHEPDAVEGEDREQLQLVARLGHEA